MLISELQAELEAIKKEHGDIPIVRKEEYGRHKEYADPEMYSAKNLFKHLLKVRLRYDGKPMLMGGYHYIEVRHG